MAKKTTRSKSKTVRVRKPKVNKKVIVESRHQLHNLLDYILSKSAETGKTYAGKYQLPLNTVVTEAGEGIVSFDVTIVAECTGRFANETSGNNEDNTDSGIH